MRVTQEGLYRNMIANIQKKIEDISTYNEQISSGKKLLYLSDNPIDGAELIKFKKTLSDIEQFNRDITMGNTWLKSTQNALENVESQVRSAKSLTEQLATETYDYSNRLDVSYTIDSIASEIMQTANTDINGKHIFSGFKTDSQPFAIPDSAFSATGSGGHTFTVSGYNHDFDLDLRIEAIDATHYKFSVDGGNTYIDNNGTGFTFGSVNSILGFTISVAGGAATANETASFDIKHEYQGDEGDIKIETNKGEKVTVNLQGNDVFTSSDNKNIFKIMGNLWAGVKTNNRNLISEQLPKLTNFEKHDLKMQAFTGASLNRLDTIKNDILLKDKESTESSVSDLEDVDISDVMTKLMLSQTVYQASLRATSMITNLNITNFI